MIDRPLSDLPAWVAYYGQAPIPVLRHTVQALDRLRENAENINGRVIAGAILHDPLMTLRVLQYIEEHRRKRQTTDITTIERALMMIGIEPFFRDFQELPLVEEQLKGHPKALLGLLKVINRARRASQWSREWAIMRHDLDVDEITVATLLHDVAEILMWCFAPNLALTVRDRQAADRALRSSVAQAEVYQVQLLELQTELSRLWRLPELLLTLMDHGKADNPRVRNVVLAIDLARHSANGWDDAALPDDFKAIEDLLHIGHRALMTKLGIESPDDGTAPQAG
jgi:HD-like signal output (HDOD) protein